jgi:hypothetical protein
MLSFVVLLRFVAQCMVGTLLRYCQDKLAMAIGNPAAGAVLHCCFTSAAHVMIHILSQGLHAVPLHLANCHCQFTKET